MKGELGAGALGVGSGIGETSTVRSVIVVVILVVPDKRASAVRNELGVAGGDVVAVVAEAVMIVGGSEMPGNEGEVYLRTIKVGVG